MSSLVKEPSNFHLTPERLELVLREIKKRIEGRVTTAYVFGSASSGDITKDSDIDLIFVKESVSAPFVQRALEFMDLYEVYPKLDILVYTQEELDQQLADSDTGFWKSVRLSMREI